jgi:hypothetical protein
VRVKALTLNLSLTLPSLKMGEGTIDILKICLALFKESQGLGLRLPAMHRNIDRLPGRIVNPHFSETAIPGFLRRVALGA